jgi:formate-dependent nitrite reductase membrane component NrfD
MEVLGFQLFFLCLIILSVLFGRNARNWVVLLSVVFTLFAVFTSGLMILQLITIFLGYGISEKIYSSYDKRQIESCSGVGCVLFYMGYYY